MAKIKGSQVNMTFEFLKEKFGTRALPGILNALTEEDRAIFSKLILNTSWVDYAAAVRFQKVMDQVCGKGDLSLLHELGVWGSRKSFSGIYKMFLAVSSPKFLMKKIGTVWKQFFDQGKVEVVEEGKDFVTLKLTEFSPMLPEHWANHKGYFEETVRLAGGKNPVGTHPKCLGRGDDCCLFKMNWE